MKWKQILLLQNNDDDDDEDDDDETLLKCLYIYLKANEGHCTKKLLIEYHINLT